jgi:hypothetical protein
MKKLLALILLLGLAGAMWGNGDVEKLLGTACAELERNCAETLSGLRAIAAGESAQKGDWIELKPLLQKLEASIPGVYFLVLPDGNYYSIALDYTNLNLSDRDYFPGLMAGDEIHGWPIYSRSSGKKSALFAVPVMRGGKCAGALGASLFLDDLSASLTGAAAIPEDFTWFVVDRDGKTILDREPEYIFMNALTEGGASLSSAIRQVIAGERGEVGYEIGDIRRQAAYRKLATLDWWMLMARRDIPELRMPDKMDLSLDHFVPRLQRFLQGIDDYLASSLELWQINWDQESEIRAELRRYLADQPLVMEAAFVDARGILKAVEPQDYKNFEGTDISAQSHVLEMLNKREPVFSGGFRTVEGYLAVNISHPVFTPQGKFVGSMNLLLRPELMVSSLIKDISVLENYELWIMQDDGYVVYDQDEEELGKNVLTDPMYREYGTLLELAKKISKDSRGQGQYVYLLAGHGQKGVKTAAWDTVRLRGREWRVVITHPER